MKPWLADRVAELTELCRIYASRLETWLRG
jgi:hypothetical protein